MDQDGTCEDQMTLQAISNIYTIQIYVLSTPGVDVDVDIQPHINSSDNVQSYPHVFLGHCAEVQAEYYVALSEELKDHTVEIWEIMFKMIFQSCVYEWSNHICSVFNVLYSTCDLCNIDLIEVYFQGLPRIYNDISDVLPRKRKAESLLVF